MSDISTHLIRFVASPDAAFINPATQGWTWRVVCTPDEARALAAGIDAAGWMTSHIERADAMSLADAQQKLRELKVVAKVTAPFAIDEQGDLTERAREAIRKGEMAAAKDGKPIDPDAPHE